jgi:hypothetical protein
MKSKIDWIKIANYFGVIALIIGVIDPLEGSVLISVGSILLTFSKYFKNDPRWKVYFFASVMIVTGVSFLFYLSSLGGFGGNSSLSWWWGMLILPYPLGWLLSIITLIISIVRRPTSV